jgi:hypothetical protein
MTDTHAESYQGLDTLEDARIWRFETKAMVFPQRQDTCHGPMPLFGHADAA